MSVPTHEDAARGPQALRRPTTGAPSDTATSGDTGSSTFLAGVARGGSFAAAGSAIGAALGLCLTLIVTHAVQPATAGQFFSSTAVFIVVQTFMAFGAGAGLVRFVPRFTALGRTRDIPTLMGVAFAPLVVVGIGGSVGLWAAAGVLADRVSHGHGASLVPAFHVMAALFLPGVLEIAAVESTRAFGSIRKYVVIQQLGIPLLRALLVLAATMVHAALWWVVLAWLIPLIVALLISLVVVRASLRDRLGLRWARVLPQSPWPAIAREYWGFTAARGTAMVMETLLTWLDVVLVASMVSPAKAAIYAAASRFITAGTLVLQALRLAMATDISTALARRQLARVSELYRTATQWVVLSSWPLYVVMAIFAPFVLRIFGATYPQGATATSILCLAMMLNLAAGNVGTVLLMGGKSGWVLADKTVCVALNVALNLVLIPRVGINGAAIAWAATIVLDSALSFGQVRWGMGIRGRLDGVALAAGLTVVCFGGAALLARTVAGPSLAGLTAAVLIGAITFAVPVWRWRGRLGVDVLVGALRRGRRAA